MTGLSAEEMWEALCSNDSSYDGIFFYGVRSTGIFCRPSCRSKRPVRENVVFFINSMAALREGYRPCKRCRPDLPEPVYEPMKEVVKQAQLILETEYERPGILKELPGRVGVSAAYLQRSCKKLTGASPKSYLNKVRVQKVQELLVNEDLSMADICFTVGFQSLSSFYALFRAETGLSPGEYIKRRRRKGLSPNDCS
ncbi:MAG TPA: Ada metal-binding domain-containing protein [Bacillota bacterium]|nr:Ada metal-binding domain-containing protein [Bacillota bacterium]